LVKPSCGTVALYGPFGFFLNMSSHGEIWTLKLMGYFFQKHLMFCSLGSTFFGPQNVRFQELPPPGPLTALSLIFLGTS
jgi:hypothetical protein